MAQPASFVPRSFLEHPDDFGVKTDVTWRLATSLDEAVRLARAVDQHHLALAVSRMLRRSWHARTDLAVAAGERPETMAPKLRGRRPAPERDLCVWSWMTRTRRTRPPLGELLDLGDGQDASTVLPQLGAAPTSTRRS